MSHGVHHTAPKLASLPNSSNTMAMPTNHLPHNLRSYGTANFKSLIIKPAKACATTVHCTLLSDRGSTSTLRLPSNRELDNLKRPALHCTFPSLVHPYYHSLKETCDAWIEMLVDPPTAATRRFLHDCLLPRLVCQFIPTAQLAGPRLMHAIKFISWLMVADADDDDPDVRGSDCNATTHHANLVLAILHKHKGSLVHEASMMQGKTCIERKSVIMIKALQELWEEISLEMSPSLQTRFTTTMADYFEGVKVQVLYRKQMNVPSMELYMDIRRPSSFLFPCFVLLEYALGIELDDAALSSSLLQKLQIVALDYINLCNDIFSCSSEVRRGDYFNLPFILYCHSPSKFKSLQDAINHVAQITKDLDAEAISLLTTIFKENKLLESHIVPHVHAYAYALCIGMSGTLTWFFESARYKQS